MAERNYLTTRPEESAPLADTRSVEEIRQDIAERRESIAETVDEIGDRVSRTLDWREYLAEHPMVALGAAAGAGLLLSAIFKRRPTSGERIMYALADGVEDISDRFRYQLEHAGARAARPSKMGGLGRTAKAAIVATITKSATDYLTARVNQALQRGYEQNVDEAAEQGQDENIFHVAKRAEEVQRSEELLEEGRPEQVLREDRAREQSAG